MILTVSPNIALDRVVVVRGFKPGAPCRALSGFTQPGGSGVHASLVIQALGGETLALGLLGGHTGALWREAARRYRLRCEIVPIQGETRESYCIIDQNQGSVVESIEAGPPATATELELLLERLEHYLPAAELLVVSGSLPPGLPVDAYAKMITLARQHGLRTLADVHSQPLQYAIGQKPWLIKPNLKEFHQLLGRQTRSVDERLKACRELCEASGMSIALSMEAAGLLLTTPSGQWLLYPPQTERHLPDGAGINVIGCGDALVGALAYEFCRSGDLLSAARLGMAAAHDNLGTYGVPEIDPQAVREMAGQVRVQLV